MNTKECYHEIKKNIKEEVKLVAVSKTKPINLIMELYEEGQRIFGENKVQELSEKAEKLPKDIQWHMIGHLQTNKVKYIAPFVSLIHSVDSLKLLETINKEARKNKRIIDCLLQIHIAEEKNKFGFKKDELDKILQSPVFQEIKKQNKKDAGARIIGLMGMATFSEDKEKIKKEFKELKNIFTTLKEKYFKEETVFSEISMGMSGDYKTAIEEGSTMVRIGSSIFGARN